MAFNNSFRLPMKQNSKKYLNGDDIPTNGKHSAFRRSKGRTPRQFLENIRRRFFKTYDIGERAES